MISYKTQSHKLQIFQNVREMKVSFLGKIIKKLQFLEPKTKISFGRTLRAKLPQSHMWYWVYNCVYNWLNLEKITFFFLQLQSCDRHSITFRNHLKYIQIKSLEKVPYVQYLLKMTDYSTEPVGTEFTKSKQNRTSKNYQHLLKMTSL